MDPKETLRLARNAINDRDWEDARYLLAEYRQWRRRGGFQPKGGDKTATALYARMETQMRKQKKGTLGATFRSGGAANRRRYSSISSGAPITKHVKKACALVRTNRNGKMITKVRKGCRLTTSGARCDETVRLPSEAYDRKRKVMVDCG